MSHATRSLAITPVLALTLSATLVAQARVIVEPDYLVSRDDERPHVEIMAAVNPRNPRNLLAGSITFTGANSAMASKAYVSHDGGQAWTDVVFPEQAEHRGGDPQVAFTGAGTAVFATLTLVDKAKLHAYRSDDGGRTWSKGIDLGGSYDHPMLVADQTAGRFANRLYMAVLYGGLTYNLGVFRSEDDGRSWIGPVKFMDGEGKRGLNVMNSLILSDGALVVPIIEFPSTAAQRAAWRESRIHTAVSTDGGVTFSPARPGPLQLSGDRIREFQKSPGQAVGSWPMFAVDPSARHRDRVYAVWPDYSAGISRPRAVITWSDDRGATWRAPKPVDPAMPAAAKQFQVTVAVNRDGVVGVTWYDTRGTSGELAFNQYFAASTDGGETFTAPVRLSSAESRPISAGNLLPALSVFAGREGELRASPLFAAGRWLNGGDYIGFVTDPDGTFRSVWADARTGTYQVYTAAVRVVPDTAKAVAKAPVTAAPVTSAPVDVTKSIELVRDAGRYDPATGELELWVRLKNTSARPIHGPIVVELRRFGSGRAEDGYMWVEYAPEVLNASNKKTGAGAVFEYDAALGTERVLPPSGLSGAMLWRFRLKNFRLTPHIHVYVTGKLP